MIAVSLLAFIGALVSPAPVDSHIVTGTVIESKTHLPVHGAAVSLPNGKRLAVTDKAGRFRVKVSLAGWPSSLMIRAPGLATRSAELPHIPADADLSKISLSAAARLHVIVPPTFIAMRLRWQLKRLLADRDSGLTDEGSFPPGRIDITIDSLEAANYAFVLIGPGPLQQAVTKVAVRLGESVELPLNITPVTLNLKVVEGEKGVAGAIVRFATDDFLLQGNVQCDDQGIAVEEMWPRGDFYATFMQHDRPAFARFVHLDSDTGSIHWTFNLPSQKVRGRVIDSLTEEPLSGVALRLTGMAPREGGVSGVSTTTDADGTFEFSAVPPGSHSLRPYRKGYRYDQPLVFSTEKDDGDYQTTIRLEKIVGAQTLTVIDWADTPVVGADMFLATRSGVVLLEHTDTDGRVTLPPQREGVVFAVPPVGSLGFTSVPSDLSHDITLHISPPGGMLEIVSRSISGDPIPDVYFMMRINGTLIPEEVLSRFVSMHASSFRTDQTGHASLSLLPGGLYEFWPIRSATEIAAITSGNPPEPAASVAVGSSPQIVTLTFRKKPSS